MNCEQRTLAYRYALAFFNKFGKTLNDDVFWHMRTAQRYITYIPSVLFFIVLIGIDESARKKMIQILLKKLQLPESFDSLLRLLIDHKRISLLPDVINAIVNLYQERNNKMLFTITTPQVLDSDGQKKIIEEFLARISSTHILTEYHQDKNLVAGLRALNNNYLWEYSIESQLWNVRNSLVN